MSYPRSLSYFLNHLAGLSKNKVKFYPQSPQYVVRSGNIIRVTLPQNTLVDLRTLTFNFKGSTMTSAGFAAFPKHIETIIDSTSLECNGKPIQPATVANNIVWKTLADYHFKDRESSRFLQNGFGQLGAPVANVANEQYSVVNWLGFVGTCLPEVIDTSMIGDCVLVIRLATNQLLCKSAACAGEEFQLDAINFVVDTISLDDGGLYYSALQKRLEQGSIQIPYQYWLSFSSGPVSMPCKVLGTVSTQSLDLLYGTCLPEAYGAANNVNGITKSSDYFTRGHAGITSSTMYLNNIKYPQFDLEPYEAYQHSLHALNMSQDTVGWLDAGISTLANWKANYFTHFTRFNHSTSPDERWVSGQDTRGTMAQVRFELNGVGDVTPYLFAQCTGTLLVSGKRQIEAVW